MRSFPYFAFMSGLLLAFVLTGFAQTFFLRPFGELPSRSLKPCGAFQMVGLPASETTPLISAKSRPSPALLSFGMPRKSCCPSFR